MSNRYGRNQKRAHRAKIAKLLRRLYFESTAHLFLADDEVPDLGSIALVLEYSVMESGRAYQIFERSATLTVEDVEDLHELIFDQTPVQFQGNQYYIDNVQYEGEPYRPNKVVLELTGVV